MRARRHSHAATDELLRDLVLDPRKGLPAPRPPARRSQYMTNAQIHNPWVRAYAMSRDIT
jgi:hypothetical protein